MHKVLVCVIQPCPRGECEDRGLRFNLHANEADRSCAQESKENDTVNTKVRDCGDTIT